MFNGRRQPSRGDTSRMNREVQVRICEGLGVKLPGPTRHGGKTPSEYIFSELPQVADIVSSAFDHLATHWYCGSLF